MVYKWKYYNYPVDANVVGKALEDIEQENGEITAELFLKKATPKDSELHKLFEWDNKKAANEWRLHEARRIIGAVAVVYEENKTEPKTTRAFVNVGDIHKGSFITTAKAMSDDETRSIVLNHALNELNAFKAKYAGLNELSIIFSEIDKLSMSI